MKYQITKHALVMKIDGEERIALAAVHAIKPDEFDTEAFMTDLLEQMVTNDCFMWIGSEVTHDLTEAPMLALLGDEEESATGGPGLYLVGRPHDAEHDHYQPVLFRWAFMNYQITTPQKDLLEKGEAVWHGGIFLDRGEQNTLMRYSGEVSLNVPHQFDAEVRDEEKHWWIDSRGELKRVAELTA